jgi:hypothetical protein
VTATARALAAASIVAWLIGVVRIALVLSANAGGPPDASTMSWMLAPLASAAAVLWSTGRRSLAAVWVPVGFCWGFVVVSAWSLGLFFAWTAFLLFASGVTHGVALKPRWSLTLVPVWFLIGATGLCGVVLLIHRLRGGQYGEAEIIVHGARLFIALVAVVVAGASARRLLPRRGAVGLNSY